MRSVSFGVIGYCNGIRIGIAQFWGIVVNFFASL